MEYCINDSLARGYCSTIFSDETCYTVTEVVQELKQPGNRPTNKCTFLVTFTGTCSCADSVCSDNADNDTDFTIDFTGYDDGIIDVGPDAGCCDFDGTAEDDTCSPPDPE